MVLFAEVGVVVAVWEELLPEIGGSAEAFPFVPSSNTSDDGDFLLLLEALFGDEGVLFGSSLATSWSEDPGA